MVWFGGGSGPVQVPKLYGAWYSMAWYGLVVAVGLFKCPKLYGAWYSMAWYGLVVAGRLGRPP